MAACTGLDRQAHAEKQSALSFTCTRLESIWLVTARFWSRVLPVTLQTPINTSCSKVLWWRGLTALWSQCVSCSLRWASDWASVEQLGRELQTGYLVQTALLALVGWCPCVVLVHRESA
eukprot:1154871-Pelagomonas_calceolata.AAC.1